MADKFQWFKFTPADWMMGRIRKCPEITQARFLSLCCLYWNKEGELTTEDAIIEIDQDHFDILISKKIIKEVNENVHISFLDDQLKEVISIREKASKAGKASARKRKAESEQEFNDRSTTVDQSINQIQQTRLDKTRLEETREEERDSDSPALVSGKTMKKFLLNDTELQRLISSNTRLPPEAIRKKNRRIRRP